VYGSGCVGVRRLSLKRLRHSVVRSNREIGKLLDRFSPCGIYPPVISLFHYRNGF
jgi:hypothetical protein